MSTDVPDLNAAQRELQRLFHEAQELAGQDLDESAFFAQLLTRLLPSLATRSGAAWIRDRDRLRPACVAGWDEVGLAGDATKSDWHDKLLARCLAGGEALVCSVDDDVGSKNGNGATHGGEWSVLMAPIALRDDVQGIIEVFQPADVPQQVRQNQLTLVRRYAAIAADYLLARRLAAASAAEQAWRRWEEHAYRVGQRLELRSTAAAIANESRHLAGCDRASVVVRRGGGYRLVAASGLEEIDRRAAAVTALQRLAAAVCAIREPLYYDAQASEQSTAADDELKACLELTHAKTLVVLPLIPPAEEPLEDTGRARRKPPAPVGALLLEQMGDHLAAATILERLGPTTRHSTAALANSLAHESILLMPVWRALGQAVNWLRVNTLAKTAAIAGGLLLLIGVLLFVPAEFEVEARGTLQPRHRREVFAEIDGEIAELHVRHGDTVKAGQLLAVLQNVELEMKRAGLEGDRSATLERLMGVEATLLADDDLTKAEHLRLNGERIVLRATLENVDRQLKLLERKRGQLSVVSPLAGQVLTWNIADTLLHRPVKRGDALFSIADTSGEWVLDVHLPEDRISHVEAARQAAGGPLPVRYVAANNPGTALIGSLAEVHRRAEARPGEGNTVLLTVNIDRQQVSELRPGAEVTARVQCGRRSLGYVWLHDVWAFLQRKVFFRWL
jgi:multidrug efflux pump subunit AcrA (membrane-fusion protein)